MEYYCKSGRTKEGKSRTFIVEERPIIVSKIGGEFYAVDAICTHKSAYLPLGGMDEATVTCPIHLAGFDLKSGRLVRPISPLKVPNGIIPDLATYEVKVEEEEIKVLV